MKAMTIATGDQVKAGVAALLVHLGPRADHAAANHGTTAPGEEGEGDDQPDRAGDHQDHPDQLQVYVGGGEVEGGS
jgi:hypothetical protein